MTPLPAEVRLAEGGRRVAITWRDRLETDVSAYDLRAECPCASCVHELTGEQLLKIEDVDKDVVASSYHTVGRYALQFQWSDGHATGIYTYEGLRSNA